MNMMCRDDHRAVAAFVGVALVFLFFIARVLAAEHDGAVDSAPIVPSTTLEPAGRHNADAVGAAATDVAGKDLPSESGNPGIGLTPFKYRTLAGYAPVVSAFFDDDGETFDRGPVSCGAFRACRREGLASRCGCARQLARQEGCHLCGHAFFSGGLEGFDGQGGCGPDRCLPCYGDRYHSFSVSGMSP